MVAGQFGNYGETSAKPYEPDCRATMLKAWHSRVQIKGVDVVDPEPRRGKTFIQRHRYGIAVEEIGALPDYDRRVSIYIHLGKKW